MSITLEGRIASQEEGIPVPIGVRPCEIHIVPDSIQLHLVPLVSFAIVFRVSTHMDTGNPGHIHQKLKSLAATVAHHIHAVGKPHPAMAQPVFRICFQDLPFFCAGIVDTDPLALVAVDQ